MRAFLAIVLSAVHVLAVGFISYVLVFWALFPWENQEDQTSNDWLVGVAAILAASGLATFVSVAGGWKGLAKIAFGAHGAIALAILVGALDGSQHSDGRVLGLALSVELLASAAFVIRFGSPGARARPL